MIEYTSIKDIDKIIQALKSYKKIYICDGATKTNFATALFWIDNENKLKCYNKHVLFCEHPATLDEIKHHFKNMLIEGFKILVLDL